MSVVQALFRPIRGQYPGHVITVDQSEVSCPGIVVQMRVRGEDESENVQGPSTMLRIMKFNYKLCLNRIRKGSTFSISNYGSLHLKRKKRLSKIP